MDAPWAICFRGWDPTSESSDLATLVRDRPPRRRPPSLSGFVPSTQMPILAPPACPSSNDLCAKGTAQ